MADLENTPREINDALLEVLNLFKTAINGGQTAIEDANRQRQIGRAHV